jgi:hypothetical protein
MRQVYDSPRWKAVRARARERDGHRCTVGRLLGGDCRGLLHVHHLDRAADPFDLDNLATVCAAHHPRWEAVRRAVLDQRPRGEWRCPHRHPYPQGREECERRHRLTTAA